MTKDSFSQSTVRRGSAGEVETSGYRSDPLNSGRITVPREAIETTSRLEMRLDVNQIDISNERLSRVQLIWAVRTRGKIAC